MTLAPDDPSSDDTASTSSAGDPGGWWRSAVIYQVYIRSFADGDGDGIGDIAGIRAHLPHLADLGVDALWITPWYPSPMADGGYDVADYRDIDPLFGTLDAAEALIADAHDHGLRVLLDIVPNHTSSAHRWFVAARAGGPTAPEREHYWFRSGAPDGGPPNDWQAMFGGPAWHQLPEDVEALGDSAAPHYLHLFAPEQPDLNWNDPSVHAEFEETLRFWFDRGVDGFRIDVAHGLVKDPSLRPVGVDTASMLAAGAARDHPFWDRDEVHEIYREWRKVADSYADTEEGPRVFVAEAWVQHDAERLAAYVRGDELHTTFNFSFLSAGFDAESLRDAIDEQLESHAMVGAPVTWVIDNHDVTRALTRYGRPQRRPRTPLWPTDTEATTDVELGTARLRAMTLFMLALPGGAYVYQGDELGLPEVEDLPENVLTDPIWERSGHRIRGRDGCRVPLPWSGTSAPFGFGPDGSTTWLPQPERWAGLTVDVERADPDSTLSLHRDALRIRRGRDDLGDGVLEWLADDNSAMLAFARSDEFVCVLNTGADPLDLPPHREVLITSAPLPGPEQIGPDTAAWLLV